MKQKKEIRPKLDVISVWPVLGGERLALSASTPWAETRIPLAGFKGREVTRVPTAIQDPQPTSALGSPWRLSTLAAAHFPTGGEFDHRPHMRQFHQHRVPSNRTRHHVQRGLDVHFFGVVYAGWLQGGSARA
jgi:hypothetical protein